MVNREATLTSPPMKTIACVDISLRDEQPSSSRSVSMVFSRVSVSYRNANGDSFIAFSALSRLSRISWHVLLGSAVVFERAERTNPVRPSARPGEGP